MGDRMLNAVQTLIAEVTPACHPETLERLEQAFRKEAGKRINRMDRREAIELAQAVYAQQQEAAQ